MRNPHVAYAEPDFVLYAGQTLPNDPSYSQLWGLPRIGADGAWDKTTGNSNVVVGVVDTGVDYRHEDLKANIWSNSGVINGCPAGTHGYNAITRSCDPMDDNNHGTHVSGTIGAAGNNGTGVAGVNWTTRIMGLKFLNSSGSDYTSAAIDAIDWAIRARQSGVNVRVLNNSWVFGGGVARGQRPSRRCRRDIQPVFNERNLVDADGHGRFERLRRELPVHRHGNERPPRALGIGHADETVMVSVPTAADRKCVQYHRDE